MTALTIEQLGRFGPERCETLTAEQALAMCRRLAKGRYENFSVLSLVVPRDLRDDFAAVYAFCRWADDLGDEAGGPERSLGLLAWWREELHRCYAGQPRHPVFLALQPVIEKHALPQRDFDDLICAFEQDQTIGRYQTWNDLLGYCALSANPVGRLVLRMCGENLQSEILEGSDAICTALQLTNHWQDVRRDLIERNRIYIPRELFPTADFESRLLGSAKQGWATDREFLSEYRAVLGECVERTWGLYERGNPLPTKLNGRSSALIWLLSNGGQHVLQQIHTWNYETALHRPKLGKLARLVLVARAWMRAKASRSGGVA